MLKEKLSLLPDAPGVYLMKDSSKKIIYVGKALSLKKRVRSYFRESSGHDAKVKLMVSKICDLEWIITVNELEALILECNLIKKHRPKYNVRLKDDKGYPYIKVTVSENFPRVYVTRSVVADKARYFGPYTDSNAVKDIVHWLRKTFSLRTCKHLEKRRPCLQYHIKRCSAPCADLITEGEYKKVIEDICRFLCGYTDKVIASLKNELVLSAESLNFEQAAKLRDRILALQNLIIKQSVQVAAGDRDVIGYEQADGIAYIELFLVRAGKLLWRERFVLEIGINDSQGEIISGFIKEYYTRASFVPEEILLPCVLEDKDVITEWLTLVKGKKTVLLMPKMGKKYELLKMAELNAKEWRNINEKTIERGIDTVACLEELKQVLALPNFPTRIECYDISHFQGTDTVASMVVFTDGKMDKSEYKRFRIKTLAEREVDDFKAMREVIARRCGKRDEWQLPELMVIDGGKGQLSVANQVLVELGIKGVCIISLAKRMEEIFFPGVSEPLLLKCSSASLRLLQAVRDEAHRFALSYHRKLRGKRALASIFDDIKGLGAKRKTILLKAFKSLEGLMRASVEDIEKVEGINQKLAESIYVHLRKESSKK